MKKSKNKRFFNKLISIPSIWIVLICLWFLVFRPYGQSLSNSELYQLLFITFVPIVAWLIISLVINIQEGGVPINSIKESIASNTSHIIIILLLLLVVSNSHQIRELEKYIDDMDYNVSINNDSISSNNDSISYNEARISDNEDNISRINNYYLYKN
jgi:hypothetical protein